MGQSASVGPGCSQLDAHTAAVMSQYNLEASHVETLWRKFVEYDEDGNGSWSTSEFNRFIHNFPDTLISPSLEALVKLASPTRDGNLTFIDFLISICSFCALSKEELLQFLYVVVDFDRSGVLDKGELFSFFAATVRMKPRRKHVRHKQIRKRYIYPPNYLKALEEFQNGEWTGLIFEEFCLMCDLFPHLAFPVVHLQDQLRRRMLGAAFWRAWDLERLKIFHLEAESKSVAFRAKSLISNEQVDVVKPGRVSMKEVFEFTKRNGLRDRDAAAVAASASSDQTSYTKARDAVLRRAPLLNLIRNPVSVYYVPLHQNEAPATVAAARDDRRRGGFLSGLDQQARFF